MGKPTCVLAHGARLAPSARIINGGKSDSLIRVGRFSHVEGELLVFPHGGEVIIGDWCFIGGGSRIWSAESIVIGNRVLISHNVNIFDSLTHPIDPVRRHQHYREILTTGHPHAIDLGEIPVVIEDDAWIGAGAMVLRGTRIGARSIVGAGSVVTRTVPSDVIVAGNPAHLVRPITETDRNAVAEDFG
jgi:acetyltransferase-like isoleucine patch superfamily enzyme